MTRFVLGLVLAFTLIGGAAEAQEDVAIRFYIVPKVGDGLSLPTAFRPKYVPELGVSYSAMDYGKEDTMLVGADVTSAQHQSLNANLDVTAIPQNLDSNVSSAALVTIQNKLEAIKVPGSWVTTSTTYRQVVGNIGRIFLLMQRFDGLHARTFFQSGITLDTRVNQLTTEQRNALQDAAISLGLDIQFITSTTTVRTMLRTWVQQMGPLTLHGETF